MKINKLLLGLLVMAALSFTACSSDDDYEMATVSGEQVYFSNAMEEVFEIDLKNTVTNLPVYRINSKGSYTAQIKVELSEGSKFSVPNSVTFNDGETVAQLPITYTPADIVPGSYEKLTLTLTDEKNLTPYGPSTYTCQLGAAAWSEWGNYVWETSKGTVKASTCTYTYNNYYVGDDVELPFQMRRNAVTPNLYQFKIGNPDIPNKGWASGVTLVLDYDSETDHVTCAPQFAANNATYGNVTVADSYYYWFNVRGTAIEKMTEDDYGHFDPEGGYIYIPMAWYVSAGPFGYNIETVTIDGYDRADLSVEAEYAGKFIDAQDNYSIVIRVALGADLSKANVALVLGEPTEEDIEAITAGTYQPMQEITESGEVRFDAAELEDGDYTIVVVPFVERDAQEPSFATFSYVTAGKEKWTLVGTGDFTYLQFFADEDENENVIPVVDEGLELYRSDDDATRFKITHWGYNADFIFNWDGAQSVVVSENFTGYEHPNYGPVYTQEAANYNPNKYANYPSEYDAESSTFQFCLAYYVEQGAFAVGYEPFKVNWNATSRSLMPASASVKNMLVRQLELQPYNRYQYMLSAKSSKQLKNNLKLK